MDESPVRGRVGMDMKSVGTGAERTKIPSPCTMLLHPINCHMIAINSLKKFTFSFLSL